jgi:hypothetical protein
MMAQPRYFEPIREAAARRWEQLERDPELAAPWHLLFKQVQSPRHVLSELLQNADDAGATETAVRMENGVFVFTHNGVDFTEDHFASLCRFGYSNKRALHTIGFRGIGFKSSFSLGDTVELLTPTLSVAFDRKRFTEPRWIPALDLSGMTQVRVRISDEPREQEISKNLDDWLRSPLSLLFLKHIRKMKIGDKELHWESLGPGPAPQSEWIAINGIEDDAYLIARSAAEQFPEEALAEIRQERQVSEAQLTDFPPSTVELVFGTKGQLFVVLPTGIETALPFACNAPFIQDPSRLKIQDPEISPTNRWLLERLGKLAASVMLQWLGDTQAPIPERSRAYEILPDVDRNDNSLQGTCAAIVEEAFDESIQGQKLLLTEEGDLKGIKESIIVPDELLDVWTPEQVGAFLAKNNRPPFSRYVGAQNRKKLIHWGFLERIGKEDVLTSLQTKHLSKPLDWPRCLKLWAYIAPDVTGYNWRIDKRNLRIVPVQGKEILYASSEVVRLDEKQLLQSDNDWQFLAEHLIMLDQNWPHWLADQRRLIEKGGTPAAKTEVAAAFGVLNAIGLSEASDVSTVVDQVATAFFSQESVPRSGCVQLAQITAKLGAAVGPSFRFVTQDNLLRSTDKNVLSDSDGGLESLVPESWRKAHFLHRDYWASFNSCTRDEWLKWISSGRSELLEFVPLRPERSTFWWREKLEAELRRRGSNGPVFYPYQRGDFIIEDWNFEEVHWRHWTSLAKDDPSIWLQIVERILVQPSGFWTRAKSANVIQVARGRERSIQTILPSWVMTLKQLPCLPDTHGFYHKPEELLVRTPETEPLLDVELFVSARLDRESSRPLLTLLGVRGKPTGPEPLLDYLRALSNAEKPPIHEVEKWYRRLDQLIDNCSTRDSAIIKSAFRNEPIILTETLTWTNASGVFLFSDEEDVLGAETIRRSVQDLALWGKVGVADRPSIDLVIAWLNQLSPGSLLSQADLRRIKPIIRRHPTRVWNECDHWLNLAGEWVPTATLGYGLSMQSLVGWKHLHEWVKQKTADLQQLSAQVLESAPFADIPSLASHIEERFNAAPILSEHPQAPHWLKQLGLEFQRIELIDADETSRIRSLGRDLAETLWQVTDQFELVPYIDGAPAGLPRAAEVVWRDKILYVKDRSHARLARVVSQELGRVFGKPEIIDAVTMCFDRPAEFVSEYMEENFTLVPSVIAAGTPTDIRSKEALPTKVDEQTPMQPLSESDGQTTAPKDEIASELFNEDDGVQEGEVVEQNVEPVPNGGKVRHNGPSTKPERPSIMERFAHAQGFKRDGDGRYFHADGSWIEKLHGERFWQRQNGKGELVRYYWPKDHCLECEPMQIETEIWGLFDKYPDTYALVVTDLQNHPIEITGTRLLNMHNVGLIKLYPATYRLVYQNALKK